MGTFIHLFLCCLCVVSLWGVDCNKETSDSKTDGMNNKTSIPDKDLTHLFSPWVTIFIPSVFSVVFLLSLPFNVAAIVIFLFRIHVKTPAVVFMLNLALADVVFVLIMPFQILYRFLGNNWLIGEWMCRLFVSTFYSNMYCSILLTTSISVDRFLVVVYPMRSLLWRTVRKAWLVCLVIWVVSITGTIPLLRNKITFHNHQLNITFCYDVLEHKEIYLYFTTFILIFFFLPFIITIFCYVVIIRSLSLPKIKSTFKKSRSVVLCITVLFEFIICFGPTNVIFLIHYLSLDKPFEDTVYFAYVLSVCISSISCCLDPVIYYYGSSKMHVYKSVCCGNAKNN